jgi:hypothetical protein
VSKHHPFCNFWDRPMPCKCESMWALYPLQPGDTANDLVARHFPSVVIRPGTGGDDPLEVKGEKGQP